MRDIDQPLRWTDHPIANVLAGTIRYAMEFTFYWVVLRAFVGGDALHFEPRTALVIAVTLGLLRSTLRSLIARSWQTA